MYEHVEISTHDLLLSVFYKPYADNSSGNSDVKNQKSLGFKGQLVHNEQ